jgi:hypothetical protein
MRAREGRHKGLRDQLTFAARCITTGADIVMESIALIERVVSATLCLQVRVAFNPASHLRHRTA